MKRKLGNFIFKSAVCLLFVALTFAAGCSQGAVTTLGASYFLSNSGNTATISKVDETNVYKASFSPSASSSKISALLEDGDDTNTYTTHLTNTTYNDVECYLLETKLSTRISYSIDGVNQGTFDDEITTKVYFLSVAQKLKPLFSQRIVDANSPLLENNNYKIVHLKYTIETTYGEKTATTNFKKEEGNFSISEGEREYKKYNKATYYFDNETLLLIPRTIDLNSSSSLSFSSIDALAGTNRTLLLRADTTTPTEDIKYSAEGLENTVKGTYYINSQAYFRDENNIQVIPCNVVDISISGKFSGTPIKCWYAKYDLNKARARLIKMETEAMYSMGTFTYNITSSTEND